MMVHGGCRRGAVALLAGSLIACGDPPTTDDRGYTKAPLENPQPLITGERPGEMARYGQPNRVVAEAIELPEQAPPAAEPAGPPAQAVDLPEGVTQEMVAQGEEIFNRTSTCFSCHGPNATGGPLAPALNEPDWIHIDGSFEEIERIIDEGVAVPQQYPAPMPARGGATLSAEQLRSLAAYVYAISR
jgi:mono/diheme cytochrome c family protein